MFSQLTNTKLKIGLQVPVINTFSGAVWGDEVMAVGLADAFSQMDCVQMAEVYDPVTIHDNLDIIIYFYPYPQTRYIPGAYNIWWFQAPISPEAAGDDLNRTISLYNTFFAAGLQLSEILRQHGVSDPLFLPMSANHNFYKPVEPVDELSHDVVFCGNNNRTMEDIEKYLIPLVDSGLKIYGSGWESIPQLKPAVMGPLHPKYVPALYSSSKIVLSAHTAWHRNMDVPTSRLWEALACGAFVVSDKLPTAMDIFGDTIAWTDGGEHLKKLVAYYLENDNERQQMAQKGRKLVLENYTFEHHAKRIMDFLKNSGGIWHDESYPKPAATGENLTSKLSEAPDAASASEQEPPPNKMDIRAQQYLQIANQYKELGELERALVNYKRALDAKPDYFDALKLYGITLVELEQTEKAIEIFQQAVKLNPTSPSLYGELGKCLYKIGQLEDAKNAFQKALELNPRDSQDYSNLGVLFWETGNVDAAIENLQQAIEINPDDADALANLAIICYQTELFSEAIPLFKKFLIRQPQDAQMHFYLGDCYFQTGENLRAKEELEIVLAVEPEHQLAQNLYEKLKNLEGIK